MTLHTFLVRQGDEAASPFSINLSAMEPLTMPELYDVCEKAERIQLQHHSTLLLEAWLQSLDCMAMAAPVSMAQST